MSQSKSVTQHLPPLTVRASFQLATLDREKRTVEIVWTTGARVLRGFWERFYEELSLDPKHVRMERINSGRAPFLQDHDNRLRSVAGVIERAWLTKTEGRAVVRFLRAGVDPAVDAYFERVADGIAPNVSVGYSILRMEKIEDSADKIPVYRATDWEPAEVSGVAIGADPGASARSADAQPMTPCVVITRSGEAPRKESKKMDPENDNAEQSPVMAERQRGLDIRHVVKLGRLGDDVADKLISDGATVEAARAHVLEELGKRTAPLNSHVRIELGASHDSADQRVRSMADALAHRAGSRAALPDHARQFAGLSMMDMARCALEARGVSTRLMSGSTLLRRALHTTSDFAALLQSTGERMMLEGYTAYPGGVKQISRQSSARDFRAKALLRVSEPPALLEVPEHGEVKSGTMAEATTSYALKTFARIFGLSRQAIINDDLGAFDLLRSFGRAAAELEATTIAKLLIANKLANGNTLFTSGNGNLAAVGSAIEIPALGEALRSMRVQKDLNGATPLNIIPRFLVVPAALEVVALKYVAEIVASEAANVNPMARRLEAVVDPRLDADNAQAWYVAADPNVTPAIEHCFLEGQTGPEIIMEEGFDVEGTRWKCRLDFNAAVVSHQGLYKNPGATP